MSEPTGSIEPSTVDVDRKVGITIVWSDGHVSTFPVLPLRQRCPCAECRGARDAGRDPWPKPGSPEPVEMVGAEMTGGWGISVTWNDGHSTGIYAWEHLRAWDDQDS